MRLLPPATMKEDSPIEAFRAVYHALFPQVYKYVFLRVAGRTEAEDLTAEVFRKALKAFERYSRDKASPRTWIFAIAQNTLRDHYRAKKVRTVLGLELLSGLFSPEPGPSERAESDDDRERLASAVRELDDSSREAVALKFGLGLNNREIAERLGLSESNVGTKLHRALSRLKERLGREEG